MTTRPVRADDHPMSSLALAPQTTDQELLGRLRAGDEAAFAELVDGLGPLMMRLALGHVRTRAVAEEVVQEAWLGVISGLGSFECRSSLKTWILRILVNRAKTRGEREARSIAFSCVGVDDDGPAVDPDRFFGPDHPRWPGGWCAPPVALPEERLAGQETLALVTHVIDELPGRQRDVIVMRDVQGWDAEDVCAALGVSEGNQRVLLHRARSRVRAALEQDLQA
jgi:RNA polymerase sigma-70 factor (ECF subfamily)